MNILMTHFRVGETDGVSLEMDKWKLQFEKMGHKVMYLAGTEGTTKAEVVPELDFRSINNLKFFRNCYEKMSDYNEPYELVADMEDFSDELSKEIAEVIRNNEIDLLVPNNVLSLGLSIPVGMAFAKAIDDTGVKVICHHHDFHWERERYQNPTSQLVKDYLVKYFPYLGENVSHCCINHIAKAELKKRKNIDATVVPNVFDYMQKEWIKDEYNSDMRERLGIGEEDIVFLQATRIAHRKAIEIAVDLMARIKERKAELVGKKLYSGNSFSDDNRIIFVLAGLNEMEEDRFKKLVSKMDRLGIDYVFASDLIKHSRKMQGDEKLYSLWDAYTVSDFITYPSILEGWGNQFLEAVFAKKPQVVYEYPVYGTDIASYNFGVVSLGSEHFKDADDLFKVSDEVIDTSVSRIFEILTNKDAYEEIVSRNFDIARKELSYEKLYEILESITR